MISRFMPFVLLTLSILFMFCASQLIASRSASSRYKECSQLVGKDPAQALEKSRTWLKKNTSSPFAHHCEALALYGMKDYAGAAQTLLALAKNAMPQNPALATHLYSQAANAYNMAGQIDMGIRMLSDSLNAGNLPIASKTELLIARARLYLCAKQPQKAEKDAREAIVVQPNDIAAKSLLTEITRKNN